MRRNSTLISMNNNNCIIRTYLRCNCKKKEEEELAVVNYLMRLTTVFACCSWLTNRWRHRRWWWLWSPLRGCRREQVLHAASMSKCKTVRSNNGPKPSPILRPTWFLWRARHSCTYYPISTLLELLGEQSNKGLFTFS